MSMSTTLLNKTRSRRITVAAVREVLRDLATEFPGRADRRAADGLPARYIDRGQPCCLVALVLTRLGYSVGVLRALDAEHGTGNVIAGVQIGESRHPALRKVDPLARRLLQHIQYMQDRGCAWDKIISEAFTPSRWFPRQDRERKPWLYLPS